MSEMFEKETNSSHKCTTLDLSNKNLKCLPMIEMNNLQLLYLENNELTELPHYIFLDAPNLRWLDVRNNSLQKVPESIENHCCIETLLLQNNRISYLPIALGTVKSLRSIQLSGNPMIFPKKGIINSGTEAILRFLSIEYNKERGFGKRKDECDPIDVSLKRTKEPRELNLIDGYELNSIGNVSDHEDTESRSSCSESGISQSNPTKKFQEIAEVNRKNMKKTPLFRCEFGTNGVNHLKNKLLFQNYNSEKYLKETAIRNKEEQEEKIRENYIKDLQLEKKRDLLNRREKVLQDRKSLEALRNWRNDYKEIQVKNTNTYYALNLSNIPYDTDLNYVKILTRADIEKDLPDKYKRNIRNRAKSLKKKNKEQNVQMKIDELVECLQNIETDTFDLTPRTERKMISCEIKKLSDIKKKITKLKSENDDSFF